MTENSILNEIPENPEAVLGPPQIDLIGTGLMTLLAVFCGILTSIAVLMTSFFSLGKLSFDMGVSPMILAMISFFAILFSSYVYIWGASTIFPAFYTRGKMFYVQVTIYMIILYICILPIYLVVHSLSFSTTNVLIVYLIHILLAVFGIELIMALIAQYRYFLLSLYANIIGLILSGGIVFWILSQSTRSESTLFILMGLAVLAFVLFTGLTYCVRAGYFLYYKATGNDPLGMVFSQIEAEDREKISHAERELFR